MLSVLCFSLSLQHLIGVDFKKIQKCIGDPEADVDNPILKAEQDTQVRLLVCYY